MDWMTPVRPVLESGLLDVERSIYRLSGKFALPKPVIQWKKSYCGELKIICQKATVCDMETTVQALQTLKIQ